jgi:hypothetical protein
VLISLIIAEQEEKRQTNEKTKTEGRQGEKLQVYES